MFSGVKCVFFPVLIWYALFSFKTDYSTPYLFKFARQVAEYHAEIKPYSESLITALNGSCFWGLKMASRRARRVPAYSARSTREGGANRYKTSTEGKINMKRNCHDKCRKGDAICRDRIYLFIARCYCQLKKQNTNKITRQQLMLTKFTKMT